MVPFQTKGGRFLPWTDRREVVNFLSFQSWFFLKATHVKNIDSDLDKDGNLDLVTIGADETETVMMRVYLNNTNNVFTQGITWQSEIFGVTAGAIAFADYNGDGTVNVIDVVALVHFVLNN